MTMTQQEVIKAFMASLANHGYSADSAASGMLDSAIRASSRYSSASDVAAAMTADQLAAEKAAVEEILGSDYAGKTLAEVPSDIRAASAEEYDTNNIGNGYLNQWNDSRSTVEHLIKERKSIIFLRDYCGIVLENNYFINSSDGVEHYDGNKTGNTDTGAITGSDAGGSATEKTAASVVPETYANTYKATTSAAQTIITNKRNWVVQATAADDTITANGADSINAAAGNDSITVNASGATVTSGAGEDVITVNQTVNDITLSDLNSDDTLTISGEFEIGSAHIEDTLLVVTDKTGTRKIRLGDFDNAQNASVNINGSASTTIAQWLSKAGIVYSSLSDKSYAAQVLGNNNSTTEEISGEDEGRIALDDYTPPPAVEEPVVQQPNRIKAFGSFNTTNGDGSVTVDLATVDASKAGDVTVNGQVVGAVSSEFPNAATFTRNGLTIHLLGESSSSSPNNITAKKFDDLTNDQKTIVASLFKWWADEALKLNEESYGIGFNSSTAMVKDIGLYFYNDSNNILATVWNWQRTIDGTAVQLMLNVNMNYYSGISANDMNGISNVNGAGYLDRTLAHEFTHAVMGTNINFFNSLPQFIKEGSAELTHGIDDERGNVIFRLGYDADSLADSLNLTNTGTGQGDAYAGGFMFMRYLAKQAAANSLPAFGEITATVNVSTDGIYYINGTTTTETAQVATSEADVPTGAIKLGTMSGGVYTVNDTGVHQNISGVNQVAGLTVNDTFTGTDGNDTVTTAQGSNIITGGGDDSIDVYGQYATINAGAGADTVNVLDGSHHSIDAGDGDNIINFSPNYNFNNTVISGEGNDIVSIKYVEKSTFDLGAGVDVISIADGQKNILNLGAGNDYASVGSSNSTILAGDGDDTVKFRYINQENMFVDLGAGEDVIVVGGTSNTIVGGAGDDIIYQNSNATYTHGNVFVFDTEDFGEDIITNFKTDDKLILGAGFGYSVANGVDSNLGAFSHVTVTKGTATVGTIVALTSNFDAATNIVTMEADSMVEIEGLTYNAAGGYYEISDAQDLVALATYVNAGNGCRDMTFKVTGNIDMSTVDGNFTPIGKSDKPFAGTFDGDDKTISNLSIDTNELCVALFGKLDASGTIKNVVLSNATVEGTYSGNGVIGSLVGGLVGSNYGTVTNCKVDAKLIGIFAEKCGALVCKNHGIVTGNTFHSNFGAVYSNTDSGTASDNTRVYAVNAPEGFTIIDATCTDESNVVTIGDKTFYKQGAQVTATVKATDNHLVIDGEQSFTATIGTADATLDVQYHVQIAGGDEDYMNEYSNVSVLGSAGDDLIVNTGNNVTIDGGEGNDEIYNNVNGVLIDVSKGDDLINSGGWGVTEFDVRGFGVGDVIQFTDLFGSSVEVTKLETVNGKLIATVGNGGKVTIGGISAVSTLDNLWALEGNVAKYGDGTTAGAAVSDGKIIFNDATVTNAKVQLGGISNVDGLSVYNKNVNIHASAVAAGGASIVSNEDNYAFYLFDDWNGKTFTGTDDADNIDNYGSNVSVNAGAGNDTIQNYGSNNIIDGGNGSDSIRNDGYNNTIDGGAGNDNITSNGKNNLIDGGADDDTIFLANGTGNTINTAQGDDTIQISTRNNVNDFTVEGFGVGDVIQFIKFDNEAFNYVPVAIDSLTTDNGKLVATAGGKTVTINGINAVPTAVNNLWALDGNVAKYGDGTTAGATIDSGKIIFTNATVPNAKVELGGISNLDGLNVNEFNEVKINASAVAAGGASVVSNSGNYAFYLDGDWDGKTFTGTENADNIILNGTATKVSVNAGAGNDTIKNNASNNTIDGGAGDDEIVNLGSNNSIDGGAGDDSIGNYGDNNTIDGGDGNDSIYLKGTGTGNTVNTAQGNDTIKINTRNDVNDFTVEDFTAGDVIQFIGYVKNDNFDPNPERLDDPDNPQEVEVAFDIDSLTTVDGGKLVATAGGKNVTISGLDLSQENGGWKLNNNVATYSTSLTSGAYIDGDKISFRESTIVEQVQLDGISNLDGVSIEKLTDFDAVNIHASVVGDNGASVVSNSGNYAFYLDGDWDGKTFTGSEDTDNIENYGLNNSIDGGAGNDTIENSGTNVTIDGGAGDDYILNHGSNVSIDGGAGNDNITVYNLNNSIDGGEDNDTILLAGTTGNTINTAQGDDTIKIDTEELAEEFTVENFNVGDVIQFIGYNYDNVSDPQNPKPQLVITEVAVAIDSLTMVDGKLVATSGGQSVIINGLDLSQENAWKLNNNVATYFTGTSEGAYIDDDKISFRKAKNRVDQVQLGGISNVDGLKVNNKTVNISASAVAAGGASIVSNVGNYKFTLLNDWNGKTFTGTGNADVINIDSSAKNISVVGGAGNDKINNYGSNNSIDGGAGNDYIRNDGDNHTIDGGAGDDTIENYYGSNNSIDGGEGNDNIKNYGSNNSIDGGDGNNTIFLAGETGNTINTAQGNDTIQIYTRYDVNDFTVEDFTAGDVIQFTSGTNPVNVTKLETVDGKLVATAGGKTVTINGLDLSQENGWKLDGNVATYFTGSTSGAYINGDKNISFREADTVDKLVLGGISNLDGVNVNTFNEVNIYASVVGDNGASVVSNSGNYLFYLHDNWDGKTFTGTGNADNINIDGTATNVSVNAGAGNDVITNRGSNNSIDGGAGNDEIVNYGSNVSIDGGAGNDYITNYGKNNTIDGGAGNNTIFLAGTGNTVNTAQGNDTIQIDTTNTVNDLTVEGFTAGDVIQFINRDLEPLTVTKLETVNGKLVATAGGQSVIINGLDLSQENGWKLDGNTATYFTGTSEGAFIDGDNKISFRAGTELVDKLVLDGISNLDGLNVNGTSVNIDASAVGENGASIVSKSGYYAFYLHDDWNGKTFTGNNDTDIINIDDSAKNVSVNAGAGNDNITNQGQNNTIDGGAGHDYILNYGYNNTINGGAGNDIIYNEGSNVTIDGGAGDDKITNLGSNNSIDGGAGNDSINITEGKQATLHFSAGLDTVNWVEGLAIEGLDKYSYSFQDGKNEDGTDNKLVIESGVVEAGTGDLVLTSGSNKLLIVGGAGREVGLVTKKDDGTAEVGKVAFNKPLGEMLTFSGKAGVTLNGADQVAKDKTGKKMLYYGSSVGAAEYAVNDAADDIVTINASQYSTGAENSTFTIEGTAKNNVITGSKYADSINPVANSTPSLTADTVTGGSGSDTIVYNGGKLTITDFNLNGTTDKPEVDVLQLSGDKNITTTAISGNNIVFGVANNESITLTNAFKNSSVTSVKIVNEAGTAVSNNTYYKDGHIVSEDGTEVTLTSTYRPTNAREGYVADENVTKIEAYNTSPVIIDASDTGSDEAGVSITSYAAPNTIISGEYNDTLTGATNKADLFVYKWGKDTVTNFEANDKVSITSDYDYHHVAEIVNGISITPANESQNEAGVIKFALGVAEDGRELELRGADATKAININGKNYFVAKDMFINNVANPTSVTLTSGYSGTYKAGDKVTTIDASNVSGEFGITANSLNNSIASGEQMSTIEVGGGKDTVKLYKKDEDNASALIVYKAGETNTLTIQNFGGEGSTIKLLSANASTTITKDNVQTSIKGDDVIFTITDKNGDQTVKGGTITVVGALKDAEDGTIITLLNNGSDENNVISAYTYSKTGITDYDTSSITLGSAVSGSVFAGNETDSVVGSRTSVTAVNVDASNAPRVTHLYASDEAGTIVGSAGNNSIIGGKGADSLFGAAGNDTLYGGETETGIDTLTGGQGNDVFVFDGGKVEITDYSTTGTNGVDKIFVNTNNWSLAGYAINKDDKKLTLTYGSVGGSNSETGTLVIDKGADTPLTFTDGRKTTTEYYSETGVINTNNPLTATAITLSAGTNSFDLSKTSEEHGYSDRYPRLITIDSGAVTGTNIAITGNSLNNRIDNSANSTAATLVGGAGNDTLLAGKGGGSLAGGAGNDSIILSEETGTDSILVGDFGSLTTAGNDTIRNFASGDKLVTDTNVDFMDATLRGNNLTLSFKDTNTENTRTYNKNVGTVVLTDVVKNNKAEVGIDVGGTGSAKTYKFSSDGTITIEDELRVTSTFTGRSIGGDDSNYTTINASANTRGVSIYGGKSTTELIGGTGADSIVASSSANASVTGGKGNDIFVYSGGTLTITDFGDGTDKVSLGGEGEDALTMAKLSGVKFKEVTGDKKAADIALGFGTGNTLTLRVADSVKATAFNFMDGGNTQEGAAGKSGKVYKFVDGGVAIGNSVTLLSGSGVVDLKDLSTYTSVTANYANATIKGKSTSNNITLNEAGNNGSSVIGGDAADTLTANAAVTLTGGKGNDKFIIKAKGATITDYSSGGTNGTDTISIDGALGSFSGYEISNDNDVKLTYTLQSGDDVTSNEVSVIGGAESGVKLNLVENKTNIVRKFSTVGSFNNNDTAVTLSAGVSGFDATDYNTKNSGARISSINSAAVTSANVEVKAASIASFLNNDGNTDNSVKLTGGQANDTLIAGTQGDIMNGGKGNDTLVGGEGKDVFTIGLESTEGKGSITAGNDVIVNFGEGDKLTLQDGVVLADAAIRTNQTVNEFDPTTGRLVASKTRGNLLVLTFNYADTGKVADVVTLQGVEWNEVGGTRSSVNGANVTIDDKTYTVYADGKIATDEAITLTSAYTQRTFEDTLGTDKAAAYSSIYAGGNTRGISITGGDDSKQNVNITGSKGADLIKTKAATPNGAQFTGGAGNDTFAYGGGTVTVTDFSTRGSLGSDRITLASGFAMGTSLESDAPKTLTAVAVTDGDTEDTIKLTFTSGNDLTLNVADVTKTTVTIADDQVTQAGGAGTRGTAYTFRDGVYGIGKAATVLTGTGTFGKDNGIDGTTYNSVTGGAVILDGSAATSPLRLTLTDVGKASGGSGADSLIAEKGGTLTGGNGVDTFVIAGAGDYTITDYGTGADKISLGAGFQITDVDTVSGGYKLTFGEGNETGTLTLNDIQGNTPIILTTTEYTNAAKTTTRATTATLYAAEHAVYDRASLDASKEVIYNNATKVTLTSADAHSDFGGVTGTVADYNSMNSITSYNGGTIYGNKNANTITIDNNAEVAGGLGADTYIINGGNVRIKDFGIGATTIFKKDSSTDDSERVTLASAITGKGYAYEDPTTYAPGSDTLRINGKILSVDIENIDTTAAAKADEYKGDGFTVTLYVDYNHDKKADGTITLENILRNQVSVGSADDYTVTNANASSVDLNALKIFDIQREGTTSYTSIAWGSGRGSLASLLDAEYETDTTNGTGNGRAALDDIIGKKPVAPTGDNNTGTFGGNTSGDAQLAGTSGGSTSNKNNH